MNTFASSLIVFLELQNDALTMGLAIFSIYCLDFSINAGVYASEVHGVPINQFTILLQYRRWIVPSWSIYYQCLSRKRVMLGQEGCLV